MNGEVAEQLLREDGHKVLPTFLDDLKHDRRYPPENAIIEQLANIPKISSYEPSISSPGN